MSEQNELFTRPLIEYITVVAEYCKTLEDCQGQERCFFVNILRKLLPMLYLKASLLPKYSEIPGYNEQYVTEDDYNYVRTNVSSILKEQDDFLDVFVEDFKYSDQPVLCTISENLTDIYQDLRDFLEIVRNGHEEAIKLSLHEMQESFQYNWGQKLLNSLRALHDICFSTNAHSENPYSHE